MTLGISGDDLQRIFSASQAGRPGFETVPPGNKRTVWIEPLVGTVRYMEKTASGSLHQPVFKGLREDKSPQECQEK